VLWGSISLAQYLMKSDLIDEYQFRIVPVMLGGGTLLFKEGEQKDLKLTKSKSYDSGLIMANYKLQ
jgi:dihydrofolate reductase